MQFIEKNHTFAYTVMQRIGTTPYICLYIYAMYKYYSIHMPIQLYNV